MNISKEEYFDQLIKQQINKGWIYLGRIIYNEPRFQIFTGLFGSEDLIFCRNMSYGGFQYSIGLGDFGNMVYSKTQLTILDIIKYSLLDRDHGKLNGGGHLVQQIISAGAKCKLEGMKNWIEFENF